MIGRDDGNEAKYLTRLARKRKINTNPKASGGADNHSRFLDAASSPLDKQTSRCWLASALYTPPKRSRRAAGKWVNVLSER
ncbi:hypothetical protein EVAR_45998_1 [Eumeta japonica]|uniref:Uncharacterized protein n=1 Tax=Eumeta variegata TaxID=151549 RepID=A0A4C1X9B4_EUMVA|nr:hypothetical protein EVAR_45998_1 [Eumeta japonica]